MMTPARKTYQATVEAFATKIMPHFRTQER